MSDCSLLDAGALQVEAADWYVHETAAGCMM